jgi:hypothetical protein
LKPTAFLGSGSRKSPTAQPWHFTIELQHHNFQVKLGLLHPMFAWIPSEIVQALSLRVLWCQAGAQESVAKADSPSFDQTSMDGQSAFKEKSVRVCQISMFLWQSALGARLVSWSERVCSSGKHERGEKLGFPAFSRSSQILHNPGSPSIATQICHFLLTDTDKWLPSIRLLQTPHYKQFPCSSRDLDRCYISDYSPEVIACTKQW